MTKALTRLRTCAGWSAPFLFAYNIIRFSQVMALIVVLIPCASSKCSDKSMHTHSLSESLLLAHIIRDVTKGCGKNV